MKKLILVLISLVLIISFIGCNETTTTTSSGNKGNNKKDLVDTPAEKEIMCKITFEENGGSKVEDLSVVKGSELKKAPQTEKTNYIFDGWYLDASLKEPTVYPLEIKSDKTLYAKWIKIYDTQKCTDCNIEWDSDYNSSAIYSITPSGFELNELSQKGYTQITMTISYTVYYTKDYNIPLDIGYAGAPKYEVSIYNQDKIGKYYKDIKATKQEASYTYEYSINISEISSTRLDLEFSTNNVQNVIHFKNISISYQAVK